MDAALAEAPPGSVREGGSGDLAAAGATLESDGFALLPTPLLTADVRVDCPAGRPGRDASNGSLEVLPAQATNSAPCLARTTPPCPC